MISSLVADANGDTIFFKLLGGKKQRIFGVLLANQSLPSTLSSVLVYTNIIGILPGTP